MELLANILTVILSFAAGWLLKPAPKQSEDNDRAWADGFRAGYAGAQDDADAVRIHRDADRSYDLGYRDAIRDWTQ